MPQASLEHRKAGLPDLITSEDQLEELLSRPSDAVVEQFRTLEGPIAVLGAGGKIGPSLASMCCRAREAAGSKQDIFVVSRFSNPKARQLIESMGARTISCDLMDPDAVAKLPDAKNVLYLVGLKFGTSDNPAPTWATNTLAPAYVARRYRDARICSFSTACVYDLVRPETGGSKESDPLEPLGEYSNAAVARERLFEYQSQQFGCRIVQNRLCYAVELRYGVLVDLAQQIAAGQPIDLSMGYVNIIWQGDCNNYTIRLLEHASRPPAAFNISGVECLSVRDLAEKLASHMGMTARFRGEPLPRALLVNVSKQRQAFGDPPTPIDTVIKWVAHWIKSGGATLGKPTHFQTSDGRY